MNFWLTNSEKKKEDFDFEAFKKEHPDVHQIRYSYEMVDLIDHDFLFIRKFYL